MLIPDLHLLPEPGPKVIKLIPCSAQLSVKFYLITGKSCCCCCSFCLLSLAECDIFYAYEYENANISWHFHNFPQSKFHALLS